MNKYSWWWGLWVIMFGVIEWKALANKEEGDTLSEHVWKLMGKREYQKQGLWLLWRIGIGGLLVWLMAHFFGSA